MTDDDRAAELQEELVDYKGQKNKLRREQGKAGFEKLIELQQLQDRYELPSPSTIALWLGYAYGSRGYIAGILGDYDIETARPGTSHGQQKKTEAIREYCLERTSMPEYATIYHWQIPADADSVKLITVSDIHYGAAEWDYERWLALRDWIGEHPAVRWIGIGDYLEVSTKGSPSEESIIPHDEAKQLFMDDVEPISDQCVGLGYGNHEGRPERSTGIRENFVEGMCEKLGVEYLDVDGFVRFFVEHDDYPTRQYDLRYHHGYGGGRTPGGRMNKLLRQATYTEADAVIMGHLHTKEGLELQRMYVADDGSVRQKSIPLQFTGSFMQSKQGGYSRRKGYPPQALGAGTLIFHADRHSVHARQ